MAARMSSRTIPLRPVTHDAAAPSSSGTANALVRPADPRSPHLHLFSTVDGGHLLLPNGNRIFDVPANVFSALEEILSGEEPDLVQVALSALALSSTPYIDDTPLKMPPVRALSLAIAQSCNLGCTYCYAQGGSFGGSAVNMSLAVAMNAVDLLLSDTHAGEHVSLSFLGGEPLVNRDALRKVTEHAAAQSALRGVSISLAITTNATLLTPEDGDFFERHGFAVTISVDGPREVHNRLRPFRGGAGSYDRIMANVAPLLERQRAMQVSARVTVTPDNLGLRETLDECIDRGFHSVGFSPMLNSPTDRGVMKSADLEVMLEQMVECGSVFEQRIVDGIRYPFLNMVNAMREIHRGTHRPYPCGAGAGYFGVAADGALAACHRFVGDEHGRMGSLADGVDRDRQAIWLSERHVHNQEPCRSCWARYMCAGGCHHEVIARGRPACDYIRGWLHYCLQAHSRLLRRRPNYFSGGGVSL